MCEEMICKELCNEFIPVLKRLAGTEVYSITLGGSYGKGIADPYSDFDFSVWYEKPAAREDRRLAYEEISRLVSKWKLKNVKVDGPWPRTYAQTEEQLKLWLTGRGQPEPYEWTVWGYHILTEIYNLQIVEDPFGRIAQWKEWLSVYPEPLKMSIIKKHKSSLVYWRNDYHYQNKVRRKDAVFLASLTVRLVQDILQVVYALNEFYYPGDGMNLRYTKDFAHKPERLEERIEDLLYIEKSEDTYEIQYQKLIELIDEVLVLSSILII